MAAARFLAVIFVHVLATAVNGVHLEAHLKERLRSKRAKWSQMWSAPEMMIISSPMERKVSYTMLKNFKSVGGTVLPILDAGLVAPYGVAWDGPRSALYICDGAQRKIFRVKLKAFKCLRQCKGVEYQLKVDGNVVTVVDNVISQWASVDPKGNLYFTNQESNSVNKLPVKTIEELVSESIMAKDLRITTEPEAEGEEAAKEALQDILNATEAKKEKEEDDSKAPLGPSIYRMYEKGVSPNVDTPAGIVAEGSSLYWTNQVGGFSSGSVVEGKTNPRIKKVPGGDPAAGAADSGAADGADANAAGSGSGEDDKPTFPSERLVNNSGSAYGICLTSSKVIFSDTSHNVYAASRGSHETVALSNGLLKPRGIVWDGDQTVYVADLEGNYVVSMPVGLLKENAPTSHVLDIHSPFGLALMSDKDPVWDPFRESLNSFGMRSVGSSLLHYLLVSFIGIAHFVVW